MYIGNLEFYYGRPEKKAEHIAILKAKLGTERARTGTTTSTGMGAGLAANDSCSTSYVAPVTPPLSTASICAVTPGTTASEGFLSPAAVFARSPLTACLERTRRKPPLGSVDDAVSVLPRSLA